MNAPNAAPAALPLAGGVLRRWGPWLALVGIAVLAGAMRLTDLDGRPRGLFRDEAEKGYNAWALARTGTAIALTGRSADPIRVDPWPWMMTVMGNRTSAMYHYGAIPWMLGAERPTVASTRRPGAWVATLTVAAAGALWVRLWGAGPGLLAAWWLAFSPWHLVFSRWALEAIWVPWWMTWTLIGAAGAERGRLWGAPLAAAALGWLFYSYTGAQPFAVAWGLCLLLLLRRHAPWTLASASVAAVLMLIPVVPTLAVSLAPGGLQRLDRVALWSDPDAPGVAILAGRFLINWLRHFDPAFLFWNGDRLPRHAVPGMGQLVPVDAVLLPLGIWAAWRARRPLAWPLLAALALGPIGAALTREGLPHALRSLPMALPAAALAGLGVHTVVVRVGRSLDRVGVRPARRLLWQVLLLAGLLGFGPAAFSRYWRAAGVSPAVQVAFEAGQRHAWETLRRERRPGQRVWIDARLPYAPYFEFFFDPAPPSEVIRRQCDPQTPYRYFDPNVSAAETIWNGMATGDWLLEAIAPSGVIDARTGKPWLDPEAAARIAEPWAILRQKP